MTPSDLGYLSTSRCMSRSCSTGAVQVRCVQRTQVNDRVPGSGKARVQTTHTHTHTQTTVRVHDWPTRAPTCCNAAARRFAQNHACTHTHIHTLCRHTMGQPTPPPPESPKAHDTWPELQLRIAPHSSGRPLPLRAQADRTINVSTGVMHASHTRGTCTVYVIQTHVSVRHINETQSLTRVVLLVVLQETPGMAPPPTWGYGCG